MGIQPAGKKFVTLLLVSCILILVCSVESKDRARKFSGRVVSASTEQSREHGVPGVIVHLRLVNFSADQKDAAGGETTAPPSSGLCPPPDICEVTGRSGNFSFHQVKTGIYDLVIYKDGQLIYTKPQPLLIPELPVNTNLVISLPHQSQN
jgi:hypothetical protein